MSVGIRLLRTIWQTKRQRSALIVLTQLIMQTAVVSFTESCALRIAVMDTAAMSKASFG
jgi:hypothetical protein